MLTHIRAVHRVAGRPRTTARGAVFTLLLAAACLPLHAAVAENAPSASTSPPAAGSTTTPCSASSGSMNACSTPSHAGGAASNAKPEPGAAPAATPPATAPTPAHPGTPQRGDPRKVARGALFWQWLFRSKGA
ncbi:hypothetical protein RBI14_03745 [Alcaligenaceae bacterium B3P038]|nr:hypothetical protein [Alcaligenaceae bacterium B3P038]